MAVRWQPWQGSNARGGGPVSAIPKEVFAPVLPPPEQQRESLQRVSRHDISYIGSINLGCGLLASGLHSSQDGSDIVVGRPSKPGARFYALNLLAELDAEG